MNRSYLTQRGLVLLLVVFTLCPALYAGFRPEQQVITTDANGADCVYAADLDGDGDLDVLSASWGTYSDELGKYVGAKIALYANDGTGRFGPQQVISTEASRTESVYAADLDADGDLDVLSASYGVWTGGALTDCKIAWYANDGKGHFGPQQVISAEADWESCVYAADLDGDGDIDVLSVSYRYDDTGNLSDSKIAWYANDGSGHFGPQQVISTAADGASSVYAADLDADGDVDVLSAGSSKIAWYANEGSGQFGPQQVISTAIDEAQHVYATDLEGDGDLDVLSASLSDHKIAWYANDGKGMFGPQQVITTDAAGAKCVYAADLDGDGDLDVLSASWEDCKIAWYANDGKGMFGPQQVITTDAAGAHWVYAADVDGDGVMDVLSASWEDSTIAWYRNDGSGTFGGQQMVTKAGAGADSVYAADLDGDGDLDVLLGAFGHYDYGREVWVDGKIAWHANDGSGWFGPEQVIATGEASSVYAADLDGDGDMDVLAAFPGSGRGTVVTVAWYANDGSGRFASQQVIATGGASAQSVRAADLDGDGDLDVLWACLAYRPFNADYVLPPWIFWRANDGSGQFGAGGEVTAGEAAYPADVDGDGDLDVLSAVSYFWANNAEIGWQENDGSGQFDRWQAIAPKADGARCVYAGDLDGDGDLDVLAASSTDPDNAWVGGDIAWYASDGSGQFGSRQVITTAADGVNSVQVADLDGDDDLDVLSASWWDNKIAWYENEGSGHFGPQRVITTATVGAQCVYVADLDGDGDLDVLSASDSGVSWYENE